MPEPYMDAMLMKDRRAYEKFIADLDARGLILWTRHPKEKVTAFFVKKKTGQLRMVIDARRVNAVFAAPPGVELCTAEGLSRIELDLGQEVGDEEWRGEAGSGQPIFAGSLDAKDCLYRLRLRPDLAEYFALPPVRSSAFGHHLEGNDFGQIWPCLAALPM